MSLVLDASVALRWLLGTPDITDLAYADGVLDRLAISSAQVPAIWALEVANVVSRSEREGLVSEAQSGEFVELLEQLAIESDTRTHHAALHDTLNLSRRHGVSAYDASYLELALRTGLPLATLDRGLRETAKHIGIADAVT